MLKGKLYNFLRWSEKYIKTDMVYVVRNSFWWILEKTILFALSIATLSAFSYWATKEVYGTYNYVISALFILTIFSLPGVDKSLTRAVARGKEGMLFRCAKTQFKWGLIGSFVCFGVSAFYYMQGEIELAIIFFILLFFLPFLKPFQRFYSFWKGRKRFDIKAEYSLFYQIGSFSVLILAVFFTDNIIIILGSVFAAKFLFSLIVFKLSLNNVKNNEIENETISYGKHLTIMYAVERIGKYADKIVIWQFLGPISVAIYSFAKTPLNKITNAIPIFPLALPKLSQKNVEDPKVKANILDKFCKLFLFSFALFALYFFLLPFFFKFFFYDYIQAISYGRVLAVTLIFFPFSLLRASLVASMAEKSLYIIKIIPPFLKVGLFFILIPLYGLWGIIVAILIGTVVRSFLTFYFFIKD